MSTPARIVELEQKNALLTTELASLKRQLDWLKRQLFGEKSEKRLDIDPAVQSNLLSALGVDSPPQKTDDTETISYQRRKKNRDNALNDSGLRFSDDVPREVIVLKDPEMEALTSDQYEVIGEKISHRLALRRGSYLVLEYHRLVKYNTQSIRVLMGQAPARR